MSTEKMNFIAGCIAIIMGVFLIFIEVKQEDINYKEWGIFVTGVCVFILGLSMVSPNVINILKQLSDIPLIRRLLNIKEKKYNKNALPPEIVGPGSEGSAPSLKDSDSGRVEWCIFESNVPSYTLNTDFHFLDWNIAFDLIFSQIPGLEANSHISHWAYFLENSDEVKERAKIKFKNNKYPDVDIEKIY